MVSLNESRRIYCDEVEGNRAYYANARARKRGVRIVERVRQSAVFERDGWMCGICGEAVDPNVKWPDQMCATVDHIVPFAAGGEHSMANVQCSHWICNSRKTFKLVPSLTEGLRVG